MQIAEKRTYPFLAMLPAQALSEGDWVIAIGNPFGLSHLVSHGIVSIRYTPDAGPAPQSQQKPPPFIFTDTPINPGNSGGPLIELTGHAVGINTAIIQHAQGISLSVPTERVRAFLDEVVNAVKAR